MPTLTVQATADNWLDRYNNLANNGHDNMLHIATGGIYPSSRRSVLKFDFTALPGGAVITSATLSLYFLRGQVGDPFGRRYWAYRLTQVNWDEYWSSWSILDNSVEPELVTNGGFGADTNGWLSVYGTLASIAGGRIGNCLQITRIEDAYQSAYQTLPLVDGKQYRLCGWIKSGTSGNERFIVAIGDYGVTGSYFNIFGSTTGIWTYYEGTFIADSTKPNWNKLSLVKESPTAGTMLFDEISVELTEYLYWSVATDNTGITDGLTATITGMTDTSDFYVGDFVTVKRVTSIGFVSDVFPSKPLWVVSKTPTTVVLNENSVPPLQLNVIVTKVVSGGGNYTQEYGASVVMPYHWETGPPPVYELGTPGWVNWNVLAMVQYFKSSGGQIAYFLLKDGSESSGPIGACFYSRKDPHTTLWPKLEIVY